MNEGLCISIYLISHNNNSTDFDYSLVKTGKAISVKQLNDNTTFVQFHIAGKK